MKESVKDARLLVSGLKKDKIYSDRAKIQAKGM
jgi:hypothetical protein